MQTPVQSSLREFLQSSYTTGMIYPRCFQSGTGSAIIIYWLVYYWFIT